MTFCMTALNSVVYALCCRLTIGMLIVVGGRQKTTKLQCDHRDCSRVDTEVFDEQK